MTSIYAIRNTQYAIPSIFTPPKSILPILSGALFVLILAACQPALLEPPRLATATAVQAITPTGTAVPLILPAPTATGNPQQGAEFAPDVTNKDGLEVWINETSPAHRQVLQEMAAEFQAQSGIDLALRFVSPALLPEIVNTSVLSDTLPDVILHPIEYTVGWAERGILDADQADAIVDQIGRETFDADALALVNLDGQSAALPSDGFQQLWLYRQDWYDENGLAQPDNFTDMFNGAEQIFSRDGEGTFISGLVVPTESNLINTHRVFEQIATANGCQLIDENGEVQLLQPVCREALDFYFGIINQFSPPGVQTDTSARNAFLDGRTGLIMASPSLLPEIAASGDLAQNTGLLTVITGSGDEAVPANFSNLTYLGITPEADSEAAAAFANYWFNEGYEQWLAVEAERKVPLRLGTSDAPRRFIDNWGNTPLDNGQSLTEAFGPETVMLLRDGLTQSPRWGFREGQGALITGIYEELTFSIVLQEMLSGYFNPEKTIFEAYVRVLEQIPNYQHTVVPTPTPENS